MAAPSQDLKTQSLKNLDLKSLAEYITGSPVKQRKIIIEHKYPELDEIQTRLLYYRDARDRIAAYHQSKQKPDWLLTEATHLENLAEFSSGTTKLRFKHNARALKEYAKNFAHRKFEILSELNLKLKYADIVISVHPNLHVRERGKEKIIKLDFTVREAPTEMLKIITTMMHEATQQEGLSILPSNVLYFDVTDGIEHKATKLGVRLKANVEATCYNLSAIWDTL